MRIFHSYYYSNLWSRGLATSHDKIKPLYLHYHNIYMATKLGRMVTYLDCLFSIKSDDHIITWFCEITRQTKKHCISSTTMLMTTKCGRMMNYIEWLLPSKSNDHIIMWSCKITWQTEIIMYPLTQCIWLSILARWG